MRVRIENTNDEAPVFSAAFIERIESTKNVNFIVTTVLASDPDGDGVTYAIESSKFSVELKLSKLTTYLLNYNSLCFLG